MDGMIEYFLTALQSGFALGAGILGMLLGFAVPVLVVYGLGHSMWALHKRHVNNRLKKEFLEEHSEKRYDGQT